MAAVRPRTIGRMSPDRYRWAVVAMLWFVCFFNYADRQAIFCVFPVSRRRCSFYRRATRHHRVGLHVGLRRQRAARRPGRPTASAQDSDPRRTAVLERGHAVHRRSAPSTGNWCWCARSKGLGESFYFPASMSLISDYHGGDTRSRAMSLPSVQRLCGDHRGRNAGGLPGAASRLAVELLPLRMGRRCCSPWCCWRCCASPSAARRTRTRERGRQRAASCESLRGVFGHPMAPVLMARLRRRELRGQRVSHLAALVPGAQVRA